MVTSESMKELGQPAERGERNRLFQLNRRVFKAYLLKESLERLWDYHYEKAMFNYLQQWMDQLKCGLRAILRHAVS
jgi:hypothetical protein